jgi:integrase
MTDRRLSRGVINSRINRIKRAFKWAVAEELIPPHVLHGLQAVGGLRFGRTEARETEPVKPAQNEDVHAILPFLAPPVAAIIELQWLTGMRSGEIVIMRPCDIDKYILEGAKNIKLFVNLWRTFTVYVFRKR